MSIHASWLSTLPADLYPSFFSSDLPEMLSEGSNLYLVGHETLGMWDGDDWTYYLPDALGSMRQETDETGAVTDAREWTPYGVEVGTAQTGLGYTGEWGDAGLGRTYLRARWYDGYLNQFVSPDPIVPDYRNPQSVNRYAYVTGNPVSLIDPTGKIPNRGGIKSGDMCFSCRCGWIDWSHAGPRTARKIKDRILTDVSGGSPDYFVIYTGLASLLPPVEGFAVVQKGLSLQEQKEVSLGVFMDLEEMVEDAHLAVEMLTSRVPFGPFTRSGYSIEDLPSNLIGFHVAWMTDEPIDQEQLKDIAGPICHILDEQDSLDVFDAFEKPGWHYAKNTEWRPYEVPDHCSDNIYQVIGEKCGEIDRSWPAEFSGIVPEPLQKNGKWWWWKGPFSEAHIEPSEFEGVYLYDVPRPPGILGPI